MTSWQANIKGDIHHKTEIYDRNTLVCQFDSMEEGYLLRFNDEQNAENARLIAAAPDLYEALSELAALIRQSHPEHYECARSILNQAKEE